MTDRFYSPATEKARRLKARADAYERELQREPRYEPLYQIGRVEPVGSVELRRGYATAMSIGVSVVVFLLSVILNLVVRMMA